MEDRTQSLAKAYTPLTNVYGMNRKLAKQFGKSESEVSKVIAGIAKLVEPTIYTKIRLAAIQEFGAWKKMTVRRTS